VVAFYGLEWGYWDSVNHLMMPSTIISVRIGSDSAVVLCFQSVSQNLFRQSAWQCTSGNGLALLLDAGMIGTLWVLIMSHYILPPFFLLQDFVEKKLVVTWSGYLCSVHMSKN
jgi:hypothetical protein